MVFLPTQTYETTEKELIIDKIMYNVGHFFKNGRQKVILMKVSKLSENSCNNWLYALKNNISLSKSLNLVIVENNETQLLQLLHVQNCF